MTPDADRQTILIVDDVPTNIRVLDQLLRGAYEIRATTRGAEAMEIAAGDDPPDLILLDIIMPEMDGYEVCRRLKADERSRHIPLVFITSRSEEAEETRGFEMGAVDYITKPFSPDIVRARVKTQMDLKRYRDHLRRTNNRLRQELKKQEINIDLAKKILGLINNAASRPRHIPLSDDLTLFVDVLSIPCYAEGGDHYFVQSVTTEKGRRKTLISLKDQSGHEVGCVLRSILTDLSHNRIIQNDPGAGTGTALSRLNTDICRSGLLGPENFFTAIAAEIDHADLMFRYVSAGHPPLLLIRGDMVRPLPAAGDPGANIAVGIAETIPFREGACRLAPGDRLILYTDGLTEMPVAKGQGMIDAKTLHTIAAALLKTEWDPGSGPLPAAVLMHRLLARIATVSGETVRAADASGIQRNTSGDDVTLMCLEVEPTAPSEETILRPEDSRDLGLRADDLCGQLLCDVSARGYGIPAHAIRTALTEAVVNAWHHGNRQHPDSPITVRRRYGNDLHLEVVDQGEGFDSDTLPNPTLAENLTNPSGRGVFLIRHLADSVAWKDGGRRVDITFHRRPPSDSPDLPEDDGCYPTTDPSTERTHTMEITVTQSGNEARFEITGRIDENGAETLKKRFQDINSDNLTDAVFDFRHVTHIGSAGIGKLLLFYKDLALRDGRLRIINASPTVHELFTVLKLDTIIAITRA